MTEQAIITTTVNLLQDNIQVSAYLAEPKEPGSYPGVVVLQEIFGVNVHIRDVTERIAKLGYVAIAPALFQRTAPGFETGYTPEDIERGRGYAMQTQASELSSDIQLAIDYPKISPKSKKIALAVLASALAVMSHILQPPYQILKLQLPSTVLELLRAHQEVALPLSAAPEKFQVLSMPSLVKKMLAFHPNK